MIIFFVYFVDAVNNLLGQLYGQMFFGVVQHACADAVFSARAFQYIYVDASFATSPEGFVVGEVGEGYGLITSWVFMAITAAPLVRLNILACGQRVRASVKVMSLMRLAKP